MLDRRGSVSPDFDGDGALFSKALSSLASAALQEGGWRIALRDLSALMKGPLRLRLFLGDANSEYLEQYDWQRTNAVSPSTFTKATTPKTAGWKGVHAQYPKTPVSLIEDNAKLSVRALLASGETFGGFPVSRSIVALLDMGGVQGALGVDVGNLDEDGRIAAAEMMRRLHLALEQAAVAHSTVCAIQSQLLFSGSLLDHLPFGLIALDRTGRVINTNATGRRLIDLDSVLAVRDHRLYGCDSSENQTVQTALQNLLSSQEDSEPRLLKLYGLDNEKPWSVSISRPANQGEESARAWSSQRPAIVICLSDRDPITTVRSRQIAATYGLSPQEEMLASRIAAGDSLATVAQKTKRSVETLRTQLRAVFQKTEVRSQAELVQLVLCAPTAPGFTG
ncbi:hypothetical protein [Maricaulis sp.]|uniref:hypothetical protein n=1 Tax=Maricaulis sp. TaxID=1486257 RepID=UPI0025C57808|nr:hypothetical protein [Maricaulis sp.]